MSKFTYKQLESFYVELNAVQYHYAQALDAVHGLPSDSMIEPRIEEAIVELNELELAAKSAAARLNELVAWRAQVEKLTKLGMLSPAAREMTYDEIFFQYQESNALSWEGTYLELWGRPASVLS